MTDEQFPSPGDGPVVVVGGGVAGCVVAGRLAEAGHEVVLVEAGSGSLPADDPLLAAIDHVGARSSAGRWWTEVEVERRADGIRTAYALGRGLGGSGAVNGLLVDVDLDDPALVDPDAARSALGRVRVHRTRPDPAEAGPLASALLESGEGRPIELAVADGIRSEAAGAYLGLAAAGGSIRVVADAVATDVELRPGPPAERLAVNIADGRVVTGAAVVLCAGAIHTPALLLRSGLANAGVGTHLQDHASIEVRLRLRPGAGGPALPGGDGARPATTAIAERDGVRIVPLEHVDESPGRDAALLVVLMDPAGSTGSVGLDPDDPAGRPVVRFGAGDDPADAARLDAGVRRALDLVEAGPLSPLVESAEVGGDGPVFHASSSCGIGRALTDGARVIGDAPVFVADASAFPRIPRTGTMLPTLVQAERLVAAWSRGRMGR